jgi:IclR family transcriptional regulator, KDG regulon repressor
VALRDHSKAQILKSLDMGLRVLGCFDGARSERGVTELARELGTSKASMYRVLRTLERHRFTVQNPATGRYRLGLRLMQLGHAAMADLDLPAEARPYLNQLRDRTGETVHMDILDGDEVVCIAKADGSQAVQVMSKVGSRGPAHCVSTGKVLLAHAADPRVVEQVAAGGLVCYTERTHATVKSLLRELERIRQHGYAVNWGEWRAEARGIGAPIFDSAGQAVAAVGICSPASRLTEERAASVVPIVVETASRLSEDLGAPSGEVSTELASPAARAGDRTTTLSSD